MKKEKEKLKELQISKKIKIKSFFTGLFFSTIIVSLIYALIINLMSNNHWMFILIMGLVLTTVLYFYLFEYFYAEALKVYDERCQDINFVLIRIYNTIQVGLGAFIGAIIAWVVIR